MTALRTSLWITILWFMFSVSLNQCETQTSDGKNENETSVHVTNQSKGDGLKQPKAKGNCYKGDLVCEKDKLGYEAIAALHAQMDDDHNGDIDLEESAEFLAEELHYSKSQLADSRSKTFHMNDSHITVDDLWNIWKHSEVHNWTIDKAVEWLVYDVELSQYVETFKINAVDGSTLPRLAVNNLNYVSNILGIKNLVHKQKLALKATDVVLFGPPKYRHNYFKDIALVTALAVAAAGCWFVYRQNKQLEISLAKTMKDMENLTKSEDALKDLQDTLEKEKYKHIEQQKTLEAKAKEISEARFEAEQHKMSRELTESELNKLKQTQNELERTKEALRIAQKELDVRSTLSPSIELQRWLQITFELEQKAYNEKKALAEQQLHHAKDSIEKLRRKRSTLLGSFRMAHSGFIDETENVILCARHALEEVKHDLSEKQYRWQQIENICSFSILSNPGLRALIASTGHTDLYRFSHGGLLLEPLAPDLDDFEEIPPTYGAVMAGSHSIKQTSIKNHSMDGSSKSSDEDIAVRKRNCTTNGTEEGSSRPSFSLYPEETDSTNSSDVTASIPNKTRAPLLKCAQVNELPESTGLSIDPDSNTKSDTVLIKSDSMDSFKSSTLLQRCATPPSSLALDNSEIKGLASSVGKSPSSSAFLARTDTNSSSPSISDFVSIKGTASDSPCESETSSISDTISNKTKKAKKKLNIFSVFSKSRKELKNK